MTSSQDYKKDKDILNDFLDKKNIFAVVGVSLNANKYGHKVYQDLLNAGYQVYPIHPDNGKINGKKRYVNLKNLPYKPDVVSIVVPPNIAIQIVKQCKDLKIDKIWLQPGSESEEIINYCRDNKIKFLSNACIMVKRLQYKI